MERIVSARSALRRCLSVFGFSNLFRLKSTTVGAVFVLVLTGALASNAGATTPVGVLAGHSDVSSSGAATYGIPITLPPGTHGMQPSLALVYSSQSADGWAGYAWTLSGLSSITRCAATLDDDGLSEGVLYTSNSSYSDDFCLDGQRLRLTSGTYGAGGSTYHTEVESFAVITANVDPNVIATQGPTSFTVQTKDGRTYEYGSTPDSRIFAKGTTVVRTWALDKITDADNNYMTYQYSGNANAGLEYWPHYINYTGNGKSSTNPDHQIVFDFESRPSDVRSGYTAGSLAQNSMMLQDIKVMYGSTATFTYNLNYQQDASNGRNLLSSVQECAADGSCLPATTIAWTGGGAGQNGWIADQSTGIAVADADHAIAAHVMDVDGDGIDDLVYPDPTSGDWEVAFGLPAGGFTSPVDTGDPLYGDATYYQYAMAMNYNGKNRTSLMVPIPGGWQILLPTGNRTAGVGGIFKTPGNSIPSMNANNSVTGLPMYEGNVWMGSFNGNSLSDMFNNTGTALQLQQHDGPNDSGFTTLKVVGSGTALQNLTNHAFADVGLDFDGSGRFGALAYNGSQWLAYTSTGVGTPTLNQMGSGVTGQNVPAIPVDFNGDGLTDLLTVNSLGQWQMSFSTGTGFVTKSTNVWYDNVGKDPLIADYYGNGTQVAFVYGTSVGVTGWYQLSYTYSPTGGNITPTWTNVSAPYPTALTGSLRVGHIDASGMDDLIYAVNNGSGYTFHYKLHAGTTAPQVPDLVSKIIDGLGNYCVFQYTSMAAGDGVYSQNIQNDPATYPNMNIQPAMQVVAAYTLNDGVGSWYTLNYGYSGAQFDPQGHGFLGFYNETITDSRNGNVKWLYYNQEFPGLGQVVNESDFITVGGNSIVAHAENNAPDHIVYGTGYSTSYLPYFSTAIAHDYDMASLSSGVQGAEIRRTVTSLAASTDQNTRSTAFDAYGNVLDATTVVEDMTGSGLSYKTETTTTFSLQDYNTSNGYYCVNLPDKVQVTRSVLPSGDSESRITTYNPDTTHCQLTSSNSASAPSLSVTSTVTGAPTLTASYSYDSFGNVAGTILSGTNVSSTLSSGGRSSSATFGANGEFPTASSVKVSDSVPLPSSATWSYDLGVATSTKDANGNTTSILYDAYGRPNEVTRPGGSAVRTLYQWCSAATFTCPSSAAYELVYASLSSGGASVITTGYSAYDTFGRVVEQGTVLLGGALSLVDTTYDQYGHVIATTKPYLQDATTKYTSTISYFNQVGLPQASYTPANDQDSCNPTCQDVTTYSYSGFKTTVERQTALNADLINSANPQSTSSTTDAIGETVLVTDADGGNTSYSYDAFGDLIGTTDANGKGTTLSYDGMGHKTGMVDPNMGVWSYQVDALGEILCQTDAKGQRIIMDYDNIGRIADKYESTTSCTDKTGSPSLWTYDTQTNGLGLPASVSDPDFQRTYDYDGLSRPQDVTTTISNTSGNTSYVVSTGYDSFGRVQTVTYPASPTPIASANTPTASATASPSTQDTGILITLDGSKSTPNPSTLQYQWTQMGGPTLDLSAFDPAAETTSFTPTIGGVYTFQLKVIESNSALSAPASVSVTVKPVAPTSAPTVAPPNPSTNGNVMLTWTSVTNVTSYNVYKSTDNVNFTLVQNVADSGAGGNAYMVTGLATGTYYFAIGSKVNGVSGDRGPSATEAVLLPPSAPAQQAITLSNCVSTDGKSCNGIYSLNWNLAATATQYRIYQSSGGAYTWIDTVGNQSSRAEEVTSNGTYWYYVLACNASGCSGASNVASVAVQFPPSTPNISANPSTILPGANSTLSWSANSSPVTYYQLFNFVGTVIYSGANTSITVNPQYTKSWSVDACNTSGCSAKASVTVTVNQGTGFVAPSQSDTGSGTALYAWVAPSPSTSDAPISAGLVAPLPPLDSEPQLSGVMAPLASQLTSDSALTLVALDRQRQALVADQPVQQDENALLARVSRLDGAAPQALAVARPGEARPYVMSGQPVYAPPVYRAYANARPQPATGTQYRFTVQYSYDPASGALQAVADANTGFIYWRAATNTGIAPVDAFGHIVGYVDGNNVSTVSTFDKATGAITGIGTGVGNSSTIQQLTYTWDGFGNLQKRCDANRGLVEKPTYDGLNRIVSSHVYSGGTPGTCSAGSTTGPALTMAYDAMGNFQNRTNSGITAAGLGQNQQYNYEDPNHPYAVTSLTDKNTNTKVASYAYDANGNMYCRDQTGPTCPVNGAPQNITWNADNLPVTINAAGGSSTFSYSPDLQRYEQTSTDSTGTTITTYVGGLFEVVSSPSGVQYRNNVVAAGGIVAIHTIDQSGTAFTSYIHSDHLGSGDVITNDSGNIDADPVTGQQQVMSFDVFGLRRNPADWSYNLASINVPGLKALTDRGYTNQEQLDNVGLVHMNGRVYDPSIGRMVSADPTVPGAMNSQAFNRYSYVFNNPLNSTDPSGFAASCPSKGTKAINSGETGAITNTYCGNNDQPPQTGTHINGTSTGCSGCGGSTGEVITGAGTIFTGGSAFASRGNSSTNTSASTSPSAAATTPVTVADATSYNSYLWSDNTIELGKIELTAAPFSSLPIAPLFGVDWLNMPLTTQELDAVQQGNRQLFWHLRYKQGDPGALVGCALWCPKQDQDALGAYWQTLGTAALDSLTAGMIASGIAPTPQNVGQIGNDIMVQYANAVNTDFNGNLGNSPGVLDPYQIYLVHQTVFSSWGIPMGFWGGTPIYGQSWELPLTSPFWCPGCDTGHSVGGGN